MAGCNRSNEVTDKHLTGIVGEDNSAIEFLKPDIVIFISGTEES